MMRLMIGMRIEVTSDEMATVSTSLCIDEGERLFIGMCMAVSMAHRMH